MRIARDTGMNPLVEEGCRQRFRRSGFLGLDKFLDRDQIVGSQQLAGRDRVKGLSRSHVCSGFRKPIMLDQQVPEGNRFFLRFQVLHFLINPREQFLDLAFLADDVDDHSQGEWFLRDRRPGYPAHGRLAGTDVRQILKLDIQLPSGFGETLAYALLLTGPKILELLVGCEFAEFGLPPVVQKRVAVRKANKRLGLRREHFRRFAQLVACAGHQAMRRRQGARNHRCGA
jgi:hypothetical protein